MAQTFTVEEGANPNTTIGNLKMIMGVATLGDGSGGSSFATGLELVLGASVQGKSASAGLENITYNSNVNGDLAIGTAASGDDFYVVVWGK